ncbi:MAG: hypothetical protein JWM14_2397 [Chitinophagaceae bacterium]|nr:hypothetical protein [Chitinophagaceae bacterium]
MLQKILVYFLFLSPFIGFAQEDSTTARQLRKERRQEIKEFAKVADTSYYMSYHSQVTGRIYLSRKATSLSIQNAAHHEDLNYKPNSTLNLGIGATYKWITINLAYGFSFLNFLNPKTELGKTKYLDLQCHLYGRKIIIDGFGQFYKGFYLAPKGTATSENSYYLREDMRVNQIGLSMQYVVNNRKFSYRASFLQNEWQKKSAGAVLIGFESYIGNVRSDSSMIPFRFDSTMAKKNIREFQYYKTGPNVGCAYTLVYKKHFFVTGSVAGSLGVGNNTIVSDEGRAQNFGVSTSVFIRAFAGYNSEKWAISAIYISNNVGVNPGDISTRISLNTSNVRLNLVYRFPPPKRVKKHLDVIDKTEHYIKDKIDYDQLK